MFAHKLLGIERPIIQAPMAGVQDSTLAIAVAEAGGLGSLPCAMLSNEKLESELSTIKRATGAPINLNFFCHQTPTPNSDIEAQWLELLTPYFLELEIDPSPISKTPSRQPFSHEVADVLEPHTPSIISFHFGLPSTELLKRVKSWGTTILSSATTVDEALWLEAKGADMIIGQGIEAGGHRGLFLGAGLESQLGTSSLLEKIINSVSVPVIAAGGISTGDDIAGLIKDGAIAAQLGTAYLLCHETTTSQLHRDAIKKTKSPKTSLTNIFSGRPARGIINRAINELGPINPRAPEFPLAANLITALRNASELKGASDFSPLWCGVSTQACDEISARELTLRLTSKL